MSEPGTIDITPRLSLPLSELVFRATTGGGPGGQHVNRSATRIELWWNVATSPSLTDGERRLLLARLGTRLTDAGELRLVAAASRSQARNREEALARLKDLLARALKPVKVRRPTRVPRAAKERRLESKRQRSVRKITRRRPTDDA
jgi:ribosome-associated protein